MKSLSLFSGALGLDIGLARSDIHAVCCIEFNKHAADAIKANVPSIPVLHEDISTLHPLRSLASVCVHPDVIDIVVGGPPCQAFSTIGNRNGLEDKRGTMIHEFIRFIKDIRPKYFIMENVRGLLSMKKTKTGRAGDLFEDIQNEFGKLGYFTDTFVVNSVNYGCPQIRERVFVIGNRLEIQPMFPQSTHSEKAEDNLIPFSTLKDALSGLDDLNPEVMDFSPRKKRYLKLIPPGGNWRSLDDGLQRESMGKAYYLKGGRSAFWRRLSFNLPSPTLVTMPNHMSTSLCHPEETRALSIKECAAIQGFPSDWIFCGPTSEKYKQIGNAVPIGLGEVVGRAVMDMDQRRQPRPVGSSRHTMTMIRPQVRVNRYL